MDLELISHSSTSDSSEELKMSNPNKWRSVKKLRILKIAFISIATIVIIFNFGVGIFNLSRMDTEMKNNSNHDISDKQSSDNTVNALGKFEALQSQSQPTESKTTMQTDNKLSNKNTETSLKATLNKFILSTKERDKQMYDTLTNLSITLNDHVHAVQAENVMNDNTLGDVNNTLRKQVFNVSNNQQKMYTEIKQFHHELVTLVSEMSGTVNRNKNQIDAQIHEINTTMGRQAQTADETNSRIISDIDNLNQTHNSYVRNADAYQLIMGDLIRNMSKTVDKLDRILDKHVQRENDSATEINLRFRHLNQTLKTQEQSVMEHEKQVEAKMNTLNVSNWDFNLKLQDKLSYLNTTYSKQMNEIKLQFETIRNQTNEFMQMDNLKQTINNALAKFNSSLTARIKQQETQVLEIKKKYENLNNRLNDSTKLCSKGHGCEIISPYDGTRCFKAVTSPKVDWENAQLECNKLGGYLVEMADKTTIDYLTKAFEPLYEDGTHFWLGGKKDDQGVWRWATSGQELSVTNWAPGEPDNNKCMYFGYSGIGEKWCDHPCNSIKAYICQRNAITCDDWV